MIKYFNISFWTNDLKNTIMLDLLKSGDNPIALHLRTHMMRWIIAQVLNSLKQLVIVIQHFAYLIIKFYHYFIHLLIKSLLLILHHPVDSQNENLSFFLILHLHYFLVIRATLMYFHIIICNQWLNWTLYLLLLLWFLCFSFQVASKDLLRLFLIFFFIIWIFIIDLLVIFIILLS